METDSRHTLPSWRPFKEGAIGTEQLTPKINSVRVKTGGLQTSPWVLQGKDICVWNKTQDLDGVCALLHPRVRLFLPLKVHTTSWPTTQRGSLRYFSASQGPADTLLRLLPLLEIFQYCWFRFCWLLLMQDELRFGLTVLQTVIAFHTRQMKMPGSVRNLCKTATKPKLLSAVEAKWCEWLIWVSWIRISQPACWGEDLKWCDIIPAYHVRSLGEELDLKNAH